MGQDKQGRLKARLEHSPSHEVLLQVCTREQKRCPESSWKFWIQPLPPAPSELPQNSSLAAKHQQVLNVKVFIKSHIQIPCFTKGFSSTPNTVLPVSPSLVIFFLFLLQLENRLEIRQKTTARPEFLRWEYRADVSSGTVRGNSRSWRIWCPFLECSKKKFAGESLSRRYSSLLEMLPKPSPGLVCWECGRLEGMHQAPARKGKGERVCKHFPSEESLLSGPAGSNPRGKGLAGNEHRETRLGVKAELIRAGTGKRGDLELLREPRQRELVKTLPFELTEAKKKTPQRHHQHRKSSNGNVFTNFGDSCTESC